MAAILVMWPWSLEKYFFALTNRDSIFNLAVIVSVVSEQTIFENVDDDGGRTMDDRGLPRI